MSFFKSSFWASISTGVTMLCGLLTTKYVALIVGPEGMAFVGQFTNATTLIALLASGACISGVVKYVSEFKDAERQQRMLANAFLLVGAAILCTSLFVIVGSQFLSRNAFQSGEYWQVFGIYGLLLAFPTLNALFVAVFNGLQQIRLIATINVIAAVVNVVAVLVMGKLFGLRGVLLASTVSAFFSFFVYLYVFKRRRILSFGGITSKYHKESIRLLLGYSVMNLVSGVIAPSLQLFVRTKLLDNFDAHTAGLWQANTRLSDYYLNFVYAVIGMYYLPKLSSIEDHQELKKEIRLGFVRFIPIVIVLTIAIWLARDLIVQVFLTRQFTDMLVLLKWQLIGDVLRIASWILAYVMVAKSLRRWFIITELVFSISYVLLNYCMINQYGLVGSVYAFALNYLLYFLLVLVLLRKYIF